MPVKRSRTKPGRIELGQVVLTVNNFEQITFIDAYHQQCVLQQSSVANFKQPGTSAVWLGIPDTEADNSYTTVMHLKLYQVKRLIAALQLWVDRGTFDPNYPARERTEL